MGTVSTEVNATPEAIFAVLLDPQCYEHWVVGNRCVRGVDEDWPAVGSRFHHNVGFGPINASDSTKIVERDDPRRLVLEARAWPVGVARVALELQPLPEGRTRLTLSERPIRGPVARFHNRLQDRLINLRNRECLRRIERLVHERAGAAA